MFDIRKFNLITLSESEKLYNYQSHLLNQISEGNLTDVVLQIAILQTLSPVADNNEAIRILQTYSQQSNDVRVYVLGSFLSSTWENYKVNDFLEKLIHFIPNVEDQQKAIIYYLIAYDIFMRNEISTGKNKYVDLLNKSIAFSKRFVYNYYRLAQVSEKQRAKELMKIGLSQIESVSSNSGCEKMQIDDFISFDSFVNEHILGIYLPEGTFLELQNFYNNL